MNLLGRGEGLASGGRRLGQNRRQAGTLPLAYFNAGKGQKIFFWWQCKGNLILDTAKIKYRLIYWGEGLAIGGRRLGQNRRQAGTLPLAYSNTLS